MTEALRDIQFDQPVHSNRHKRLRAKAREMSVGMPERRLIRSKQRCTPYVDKWGKTQVPYAECGVNDPQSTRGVYRSLKSGRIINSKMFVTPADDARIKAKVNATTTATNVVDETSKVTKPKDSLMAKAKGWFRKFL